jgi:hypothetical protein
LNILHLLHTAEKSGNKIGQNIAYSYTSRKPMLMMDIGKYVRRAWIGRLWCNAYWIEVENAPKETVKINCNNLYVGQSSAKNKRNCK